MNDIIHPRLLLDALLRLARGEGFSPPSGHLSKVKMFYTCIKGFAVYTYKT